MTAAAARKWWAAHRRRSPEPMTGSAEGSNDNIARIALFLPLFVAGAMVLCAATGFTVTRLSESRIEAEQHAALQQALDEFHAQFGDVDAPDDAQLRTIARRSGLGDLRFDANPAGDGGRALQSLHDATRPHRRLVQLGRRPRHWSAPWTGCGGCWRWSAPRSHCARFLAMRAARQLLRSLDRSAEAVRKLTSQDPLTGLPNQRVMLERLDEALAKRRSGIVVFALIDLDGFREVNDTLGRAGGDAVLMNIAEHLRAGLLPGATLGRFEEDEFAVIMSSDDRRAADHARRIAARRAHAPDLHRPDVADHRRHRCRAGARGRHERRGIGPSRRPRACAPPSVKAAARRDGSSRRSKPITPSGDSSCTNCSPQSRCKHSTSNISRWSPPRAAPWSGSKRCCAGRIRPAAPSRRRSSFRWPSRAV